ncbi:sterol desaturase family protein [Oceanimonas sp. CHS3-5]|uniref:sterol desaturase family protein n=1 Tax=Oceanimonas sp. CHS3-5 TaxID=3068186 RepID=UPI00273E3F73|nr:sterol desaturase family protein [Oceanimonas sp. CHS3-5]MDP5291733.1 sterol desaturase family protein [Oceanimonas sp. CHS3-5]
MNEFEPWLRLGSFAGLLLLFLLWEQAAPRRPRQQKRWRRWLRHLALAGFNTLLVRALFPLAAVGAALLATSRGWGLLPWLNLPGWLALVLTVLILDFIIYWQHRLFHRVPLLWRLHRMHHTDTELDVTTGVRFHPLEILLSMTIKLASVMLLGASPLAVLVFEVLLNATSLFNHANIYLPPRLDALVRRLLVTPDMHRVHHSVYPKETDSNFGFNLSCWDRWLGTYRAQPRDGHLGMRLGLKEFRTPVDRTLLKLLIQPFRRTGS